MQTEVLRASLLTISPHNRAILEFFFAGAGKHLFHITTKDEADTYIIDFDHPGAREEWETLHSTQAKPFIVLSIREVKLANSIWVSKPLTSKALAEAATKVQSLLDNGISAYTTPSYTTAPAPAHRQVAPKPAVPPPPIVQPFGVTPRHINAEPAKAHTLPPQPVKVEPLRKVEEVNHASRNKPLLVKDTTTLLSEPEPPADPLQQQQRWDLLCGTAPDTKATSLQQDGCSYIPEQYLINHLLQAVQHAKIINAPVQLMVAPQHYILLLPQLYYAFSTLDIHSAEFAQLCTTPVVPNQVHIQAPNETEAHHLEAIAQQYPTHLYDLDACVWTMTLLTAKGRLSQHTDPNQAYRLKHWPNLTRLESIPHVMSIAAMWTQQTANAFEIAQLLKIPQRYVFAFHSAATHLNVLVREQAVTQPKSSSEPKKNRGLFSRLLKRLLGGGAR